MCNGLHELNHYENAIIGQWQKYLAAKSGREKSEINQYINKTFSKIISLPLGLCSETFYHFLEANRENLTDKYRWDKRIPPFFLLESHFKGKDSDSLKRVESYLIEVRSQDFDECGIEILREELGDGTLVRNVYRSGDRELISLFRKYLPKPSIELFKRDGGPLPSCIAEEAKEADSAIDALAKRNGRETLERCATLLQRKVRGEQKRVREIKRVIAVEKEEVGEALDEPGAKWLIREGNRPYLPKCRDKKLAEKIFTTAYRVPDAPTISHLTAAAALPSIIDGCLYGRQSLLNRYIPFRPATLKETDMRNGDANAICFGTQYIDGSALKPETIKITLNMKKFRERRMERLNPCLFFKQKDLGYMLDRERIVTISKEASITFNQTRNSLYLLKRHTTFILKPPSADERVRFVFVRNQHLISSNFESMTPIQTLNFFRYIDSLMVKEEGEGSDKGKNCLKIDSEAIEKIYDEIAKLGDEELLDFLTKLHQASTDTAELNFYGAYRIAPDLIEKITYIRSGCSSNNTVTLNVAELIDSLNEGDLSLYRKAKEEIPMLFQSKRFMSFLISHLQNSEALEANG